MILSVSRRTDIPALYAKWFIKRLKEKFVLVRNPFNSNQIYHIPITPENVDCIVFWTKNSKPFHKYLDIVSSMGYNYYFHFTITPYAKEIEDGLPDKKVIVKTFQELGSKIGRKKIILRYDPVLLSPKYTIDYHIKAFEKLCHNIGSYTEQIIISFLDIYNKISKNMINTNIYKPETEDIYKIAAGFSKVINQYSHITLKTCAEDINLQEFNIKNAKCIDDKLIEEITGFKLKKNIPKDNSRDYCTCIKCVDIGQYNTCIHNCAYCYAGNKNVIDYTSHNPNSPLLIGNINEKADKITPYSHKNTLSFIENTPNLSIEDFLQ